MRRDGVRVAETARALGVVRGTVCKWFRNAAASTEEQAATGGQRGRPKGAKIRSMIVEKNPKQLEFRCQPSVSVSALGQ